NHVVALLRVVFIRVNVAFDVLRPNQLTQAVVAVLRFLPVFALDSFKKSLAIEAEEHLAVEVVDELFELTVVAVTQVHGVAVLVGDPNEAAFFVEGLHSTVIEAADVAAFDFRDVLIAETVGMKLRSLRKLASRKLALSPEFFPLGVSE